MTIITNTQYKLSQPIPGEQLIQANQPPIYDTMPEVDFDQIRGLPTYSLTPPESMLSQNTLSSITSDSDSTDFLQAREESISHFREFQQKNLPSVIDIHIQQTGTASKNHLNYKRAGFRGNVYIHSNLKKGLYNLTKEMHLSLKNDSTPVIYINTSKAVDDDWWDIEEHLSRFFQEDIDKEINEHLENKSPTLTRVDEDQLKYIYKKTHNLYQIHHDKEQELKRDIISTIKDLILIYPDLKPLLNAPVSQKREVKVKLDDNYYYIHLNKKKSKITLRLVNREKTLELTSSTSLEDLEKIVARFTESKVAENNEQLKLLKDESIPWLKNVSNRKEQALLSKNKISMNASMKGYDNFEDFSKTDDTVHSKFSPFPPTELLNPYTNIVVYENHIKDPKPNTLVISSYDEIAKDSKNFLSENYALIVANGLKSDRQVHSLLTMLLKKRRGQTINHTILGMSSSVESLHIVNKMLIICSPYLSRERFRSNNLSFIREKCSALCQCNRSLSELLVLYDKQFVDIYSLYQKVKETFFCLQKIRYYYQALNLSSSTKASGLFYDPQHTLTPSSDTEHLELVFEDMLKSYIPYLLKKYPRKLSDVTECTIINQLRKLSESETALFLSMSLEAIFGIKPQTQASRLRHVTLEKRKRGQTFIEQDPGTINKRRKQTLETAVNFEKTIQYISPSLSTKPQSIGLMEVEMPSPRWAISKVSSSSTSVFHRKRWQGDLRGRIKSGYDITTDF